MLTRLTISNLKGITRTVQLEKINLVYGPNSSGKTAIIDGLKLALLGFHPKLGKKPNLTMALASPGASMMTVATDLGAITWTRNAKGAVTVDGIESAGVVPSVMLDLQEWLGLTGPAKIQYVIEHSGQVISDAVGTVEAILEQNPKITADAAKLSKVDTAKYLRELGALAKTNRQIAAAEYDVILGVIKQSLTTDAKPVENPERELKQVQAKIDAAQAKSAKAKATVEGLDRQIDSAEKSLANPKNQPGNVEELTAKLAAARADAEKIQAQITDKEAGIAVLQKRKAELEASFKSMNATADKMSEVTVEDDNLKCPCCRRVITTATRDLLMSELEILDNDINQTESALITVSKDLNRLSAEHSTLKIKWQAICSSVRVTESAIDRAKLLTEGISECRKNLEALKAQRAALPPIVESNLTELIAERDALSQKVKEFAAWKGSERERTKAIEEKAVKHQALENAKELITAIKTAEENLLGQVIGGLLQRANVLVEPVLGRAITYADGVFFLGGANLDTVSGSEESVIFAGLQLALTPMLKERILVLDELKRMDQERFEKFMLTIDDLVQKKVISQFIGIVPGGRPVTTVEFNAIECAGTSVAVSEHAVEVKEAA